MDTFICQRASSKRITSATTCKVNYYRVYEIWKRKYVELGLLLCRETLSLQLKFK